MKAITQEDFDVLVEIGQMDYVTLYYRTYERIKREIGDAVRNLAPRLRGMVLEHYWLRSPNPNYVHACDMLEEMGSDSKEMGRLLKRLKENEGRSKLFPLILLSEAQKEAI